jgi:hypothetical protein
MGITFHAGVHRLNLGMMSIQVVEAEKPVLKVMILIDGFSFFFIPPFFSYISHNPRTTRNPLTIHSHARTHARTTPYPRALNTSP